MITVIGVRFKKSGKIYYFNPADMEIVVGDNVIVETVRGIEFGKCVIGLRQVEESTVILPLKNVMRKADNNDLKRHLENKSREKEAFDICLEKIQKHKLVMKLVDVEYTFDKNKIIFYFTAEGRVDFRELVKDLASVFRTRIELRQIGVRDDAKMIGGIGACGRQMCCACHLGDFAPVSIKMAKEQNLSLNPTKISGICGRLMCCLNYEQKTYEEIRKRMPCVGSIVDTPDGQGEVVCNCVVRESVKVKRKNGDEEVINNVPITDIKLIHGNYEENIKNDDIKMETEDGEVDPNAIKQLIDDK